MDRQLPALPPGAGAAAAAVGEPEPLQKIPAAAEQQEQAKEAAKPSPQASPPDDPASEPRRTGSPTEEIEKQLVFSSPGADPEPGGGSSRGAA